MVDILGDSYERLRRTGLNYMQSGMNELQIEKSYSTRFNIQMISHPSLVSSQPQSNTNGKSPSPDPQQNVSYVQLCLGF